MKMSDRNRRLIELQEDLDEAIDTRIYLNESLYEMKFTEDEIEGALKAVVLLRQARVK